ncbi:MFS transporter [Pseudomonas palleroniana]|uniref:MFS transporter n=1 Tax=Pseudomonas palleroniana TaxID=191390 RepID=A0A1H5NUG4_9PSED|nr:multidrug effflux MFS transporter [Pseudomonas palleroniana]KAB0568938.1 multidrug effflux MFS transporter [Pseudomonas palleroniana]PTC22379.1 MFS transporter [Pseudomonas palleroniana]SEF05303.1 MFS transporter, DHA1 family, bicyclomycin/chloramphenicol resistance protein [Pseudomonas palleroniana]
MSETTDPSNRASKVAAVVLLMTMVMLGVFPIDVLLPSFPALSTHFNTTPSDIALSVSVFAIGISLSQLLIGPLSDALGRKTLLLGGMAVSVVGALGCVWATDYAAFLIFRVVQAVGCGCFVLSQALVQDLFVGKERDRLRILMVTASGIFISISPLVGSVLQQWLDWQGSFYVFAAIAIVVFVKASLSLRNPPIVNAGANLNIFKTYRQLCRHFNFIAYWLICAIVFACHFSFIVVSPLVFLEQLHMSNYEFSLMLLLYGAAYVMGGTLAGVLSKRMESATQISTGLCLIFLAGLTMLLLANLYGLAPLTVLVPMMICTAGTTITRPAATSRAMELFPDNAGASASAGNTIIFIGGGLISALVNLSPFDLQMTLAISFIVLSGVALLVNERINRAASVQSLA